MQAGWVETLGTCFLAGKREWMSGDHPGLHLYSGVVYGCRAATTGLQSPSHPCVSLRPGQA